MPKFLSAALIVTDALALVSFGELFDVYQGDLYSQKGKVCPGCLRLVLLYCEYSSLVGCVQCKFGLVYQYVGF